MKALLLLLILFLSGNTFAQTTVGSTIDPLSPSSTDTVESLIAEAQSLFLDKRPLDARAKLQQALQIAPNDYRPNFYLGVYYLTEVAHFQLADKYLSRSEAFFRKEFGSEEDGTLSVDQWRQNARLIQYLTEAKLNLDDYKAALKYADRFGRTYWDDWYPGTKAWILMKLRRVDEAIREAQMGVLRGADETRTYNILGILYSLKGNRRLALQAFGQAIKAELSLGSGNQAATPLNNAGEVYRELFQDDLAEASWIRALQLPDGCDHILPSLNLTLLYIDQLRLFQAERSLADFEACFAQRSMRADTEHRALIALARGKIALREGDIPKSISLLQEAADRQQWYGKIGTDANDLKFAAAQALSQAYLAEAARLRDIPRSNIFLKLFDRFGSIVMRFRSWWQRRGALQTAVSDLEDFEDLYIRNTDSMLEYPTLGTIFKGVPQSEAKARLEKMKRDDSRNEAAPFYDLFRMEKEVFDGSSKETISALEEILNKLREVDSLAKAEATGLLIKALKDQRGFFSGLSKDQEVRIVRLEENLFNTLPSHLRVLDLSLPVTVAVAGTPLSKDLKKELLSRRFYESPLALRYQLRIETDGVVGSDASQITLTLFDIPRETSVVSLYETVKAGDEAGFLSSFLDKVFGYRVDAQAAPLPKLELFSNE